MYIIKLNIQDACCAHDLRYTFSTVGWFFFLLVWKWFGDEIYLRLWRFTSNNIHTQKKVISIGKK